MEPIDNQRSISPKISTEEVMNDLIVTDADQPIEKGPYGAMVVAGLAVILLFIGWLLFYFVLFMRRGYVG